MAETLDPESGRLPQRRAQFTALQEQFAERAGSWYEHLSKQMTNWVPGLFVGGKAGKVPWAVVREEYQLEYGRDKLEIHRDAIHPDERVLVVDDVLATGGTALATARLVEALGGTIVGIGLLLEIVGLEGRAAFADRRLEVLASY